MASSSRTRVPAGPVTGGVREVFRLTPPVALWWVWVAFVLLNVADYAVQGLPSARFGAVLSAALLLGTGLAWTLALRPRVQADTSGVTVVNPFRVHHVPWPLITGTGTGEWVFLHYRDSAPAGPGGAGGPGAADGPVGADRKLYCWALFVSARSRRKLGRGPAAAQPRTGLVLGGRVAQWLEGSASGAGSASGSGSARMSEEARRLASLPVAAAMAERLQARAARERARAPRPGAGSGSGDGDAGVTVSWSWSPLAAVVIPALILLAVAVA